MKPPWRQALLNIPAKTNEAHSKVLRLRLLDLPDVEIDKAHREHVVDEKGELVFAVGVVRLDQRRGVIFSFASKFAFHVIDLHATQPQ